MNKHVNEPKTFWVQMVKTIHVPVCADSEDAAAEAAHENDEGSAYQGQWLHADAIVYDVNREN